MFCVCIATCRKKHNIFTYKNEVEDKKKEGETGTEPMGLDW